MKHRWEVEAEVQQLTIKCKAESNLSIWMALKSELAGLMIWLAEHPY